MRAKLQKEVKHMSKKKNNKKQMIYVKGDENRKRLEDYGICTDYAIELYKTDEMPENHRIPMVADPMFKLMLLTESRKRYSCKLLSYRLNMSYEELLKNLEFYKNVFDKSSLRNKSEIGDYVAKIGNTLVSIEMNVNNNESRNVEYSDRLYASKVIIGDKEYRYSGIIQINYNNYYYKDHDKSIEIYRVQNDEGEIYVNKTYVEIYLPIIKKKLYNLGREGLTEEERCILAMFETDMGIADELARGDDIVEEFLEEAGILVSDYDLKEAYDHTLDYGEGKRKEGFEDGLEQGIMRGKKEKSIELAKWMLGNGEKLEKIKQYTGLSIEEIQNLTGK